MKIVYKRKAVPPVVIVDGVVHKLADWEKNNKGTFWKRVERYLKNLWKALKGY
jgi:hypothetical protein